MVKAVGVGLGMQEYSRDLGVELKSRINSDLSAAIGIVKRVGLGTQRHFAVNTPWVQGELQSNVFRPF